MFPSHGGDSPPPLDDNSIMSEVMSSAISASLRHNDDILNTT